MGLCTPPAFWMPNHAVTASAEFGMSVDTASPRRSPRASSALATRLARAFTSP